MPRPKGVSISDAAAICGVEVHTLRYWEGEFNSYLQPVRSVGGQRRYRPCDLETVLTIKRLLRVEGFSIRGAARFLARGAP